MSHSRRGRGVTPSCMPASAIILRTEGNAVLLPVHAQPGARRDSIAGEHAGRLKMSVTQAAEKGKANRRILRLLAESLGVSRARLTLRSGETSSCKVVAVHDVDESAVREWLGRICAGPQ